MSKIEIYKMLDEMNAQALENFFTALADYAADQADRFHYDDADRHEMFEELRQPLWEASDIVFRRA